MGHSEARLKQSIDFGYYKLDIATPVNSPDVSRIVSDFTQDFAKAVASVKNNPAVPFSSTNDKEKTEE